MRRPSRPGAPLRRSLIAAVAVVAAAAASSTADENNDSSPGAGGGDEDVACPGGICPSPSPMADDGNDGGCGVWLGPSQIKSHHEHGFGLGLYTGRSIAAGTPVDPELLIPIHDKGTNGGWDTHPPLREYIWDGDNVPEVPLESWGDTMLFLAGVAAIAPCTSRNFNLALRPVGVDVDEGPRIKSDPDGGGDVEGSNNSETHVHRSTHPSAGSYSYRHSVSYYAVRDIVPGEELTVQCSDDDFDGGAYFLEVYDESNDAVVCVDDKVWSGRSEAVGGRGLFAKTKLEKGTLVTSTPLMPIAREELDVKYDAYDNGSDADQDEDDDDDGDYPKPSGPDKQLLLNYCFGHPDSDLLLLPYGPLFNYLNHPPIDTAPNPGTTAPKKIEPNVEIRWHSIVHDNAELPRRQQHHHPELLEMSGSAVAVTHGKGLLADLVTLRDVEEGEELYLDYGTEWEEAWRAHVTKWRETTGKKKSGNDDDDEAAYRAPWEVERSEEGKPLRTLKEQEQEGGRPYPPSVRTACHYAEGADAWNVRQPDDTRDHWAGDEYHNCLAPCAILERYLPVREGETEEDRRLHRSEGRELYVVEVFPTDEDVTSAGCHLTESYLLADVPRNGVRFVEEPYTSDTFLPEAFRREMGVPDGFYPDAWMRPKKKGGRMRRGGSGGGGTQDTLVDAEEGEEFKRKRVIKKESGAIEAEVSEFGRVA